VNNTLLLVVTFVSVMGFVFIASHLAYEYLFRKHARIRDRIRSQFGDKTADRIRSSPLFRDLQRSEADDLFQRPALMLRLRTLLDQGGLSYSVSQFFMAVIANGVLFGFFTFVVTRSELLTVIAVISASALPIVFVLTARTKRLLQLTRQLPDAFDVMSRALKAGQAVSAAFQIVAKDFSGPIAEEFSYCYEQQHLGVSQEVALRDLARRTGIMELQIFVVALIVNSRSGGNLAELLAKLATLLRKRATMQSRIRAMTGEGRLQAAVLIALPFLVFLGIYFLNRSYAEILLSRPLILSGCGVSQLLGAICIRYIIRIDV
jgi:tight adherence protein B